MYKMNEGIQIPRYVRRLMENPITAWEFVSLLAGIAITIVIFILGSGYARNLMGQIDGLRWLLSYSLLGWGLSSFVAIFIGMAVASWRYKIIAGVWSLFVLMGFGVRDLVLSGIAGFGPFAGSTFRFAILMIGCLISLVLWTKIRDKHIEQTLSFKLAAAPGSPEKPPRSPYLIQMITILSIPLLYIGIVLTSLVTFGISAILIVLLMDAGRIPILLLLASILVPVLALVGAAAAIYHSLAPKPGQAAGIKLDMSSLPVFSGVIYEVCSRVGTRAPDHVILMATPEIYVTQGKMLTWDGEVKGRILAIGTPAARDLSPAQLKAILAHEFAHFSGGDTAFSAATARVFGNIGASLQEIPGNTESPNPLSFLLRMFHLPTISFLETYYNYLLSVGIIVSRRRELRADWIAAHHYGKNAFVGGLKHIVGVGMHFPRSIQKIEINNASEVFNSYSTLMKQDGRNIEALVEKQMLIGETEFSSHPNLDVRIDSIPETVRETVAQEPDIRTELSAEEDRLANLFGWQILQIQAQAQQQKETI